MSTSLHVSNLTAQASSQELQDLFAGFGRVQSVSLSTGSGATPRSGMASVVMNDDAEAGACLRALDGFSLHGAAMRVQATSVENSPRIWGGRRPR